MDISILSFWSDGEGRIIAAGDEGLALTWTGRDWERMTTGTRSALYGLWGLDGEHLLAVGDFGLVLRWNGQRWDEFNAGTEHFLFDVWGRGLDVRIEVAERARQHHQRQSRGLLPAGGLAVAGNGSGTFLAAGDRGTVLIRDAD